MSTREKAEKILAKLYKMRYRDFIFYTVDDILARATEEEINYYYYFLIVRCCK